jgi:hypothetical protein
MSEQLFELPVLVGQDLDAGRLKKALQEDGGKRLHEVAHALLDDHSDDRAEIYEVKVCSVEIDEEYPSQVNIEFETSWNVYRGCEDMNTSGIEYEQERATYEPDGRLVFLVPPPRKHVDPC